METHTVTDLPSHVLRLSDLSSRKGTQVTLTPSDAEREAIAQSLGILGIKKLLFTASLTPSGGKDWVLSADLGATVSQECVVTLEPVTTRLDEKVTRQYVADVPEVDASEIEMPEDDTIEALPATVDVAQVMIEALSLALPPYPRRDGADIGEFVVTEPGATPLTQSEMKPFAGLAALRDKLSSDQSDDT